MDVKKNEVKDEVSKNFAFYRKKNNLTQKDLAVKLGVKNNTISQWENGINSIDIEILFRVCQILNISIKDMYGKYYIEQDKEYNFDEKNLIEDYRSLNEKGQSKILDYLEDLKTVPRYTRDEDVQTLKVAARNGKSKIDITKEQYNELIKLVEEHKKEDNSDLF